MLHYQSDSQKLNNAKTINEEFQLLHSPTKATFNTPRAQPGYLHHRRKEQHEK